MKYAFNKDIIFERVYKMIKARSEKDFKPGIVSFDDIWMNKHTFVGYKEIVCWYKSHVL